MPFDFNSFAGIAPDFFTNLADFATPENEPIPTVQNTDINRSETVSLDPILGIPQNNANPSLVTVAPPEPILEANIPAPPPVFIPTLLGGPGLIKSEGDAPAQSTPEVQTVQSAFIPSANSGGGFSNVDLGLATLAGVSILVTGAVALVRR